MSDDRIDKDSIDEVAAYLYKCFGTWKETSYYDLSEMNKDGWKVYAKEIILIVQTLLFTYIHGAILPVKKLVIIVCRKIVITPVFSELLPSLRWYYK